MKVLHSVYSQGGSVGGGLTSAAAKTLSDWPTGLYMDHLIHLKQNLEVGVSEPQGPIRSGARAMYLLELARSLSPSNWIQVQDWAGLGKIREKVTFNRSQELAGAGWVDDGVAASIQAIRPCFSGRATPLAG